MRGLAAMLMVGLMDMLVAAGTNLGWVDLIEPLKEVTGLSALLVNAPALTNSWLVSNC